MRKHRALKTCLILVVILGIGFFALTQGYGIFMKQVYPLKYSEIVEREADANGLDKALVYSVIKAESNFDPSAQSHAGAMGLMQLTPETFEWVQTKIESSRELTEEDLLDPEINIKYGCKLLSMLLGMYSSEATALAAYNAGIGTVGKWLKDPDISKDGVTLDTIPYPETRNYTAAVLKNYDIYRKLSQF